MYGGFRRDKAATPKAMDCRIISARTLPYVAKEQRFGLAKLRNSARGFEFGREKRLFDLKETF
jgi:hypothetical protein